MSEIWKPIPGFEGLYEVSNVGRVRSLWIRSKNTSRPRYTPKILALTTAKDGRRWVTISKDRKSKTRPVSQFVLEAFVGPRPSGLGRIDCCHGDLGTSSDAVSNLRWDSHRANMQDAVASGRFHGRNTLKGVACYQAKMDVNDVRAIRAEPSFYGINKMLAFAFGVSVSSIKEIRAETNYKSVAA